ncbi:hypothetical protein IPN35_01200 [Candidatus Peregrinibacteria bacterium]|nr:MAG: hypothetical protein IPN35_01200 [Candidatus Peregrinibacteria bacterium]
MNKATTLKKTVSHQTIYTFIAKDKKQGGKLFTFLRYQGKRYKWRGLTKNKIWIPNRRGIEERPHIVNEKLRYGDWESNLVISNRKGSGALATPNSSSGDEKNNDL